MNAKTLDIGLFNEGGIEFYKENRPDCIKFNICRMGYKKATKEELRDLVPVWFRCEFLTVENHEGIISKKLAILLNYWNTDEPNANPFSDMIWKYWYDPDNDIEDEESGLSKLYESAIVYETGRKEA